MEIKQHEIIKQSLSLIDRKNFLLNVLQKKNLHKLSSEILRVNKFAQALYSQEKNEKAIQFLICLDFLVKGVLIHWQIKLAETDPQKLGSKKKELMTDYGTKFPLLLGDQYNSMAYFLITRIGNVELTRILTLVEENMWKIFYNIEQFSVDFQENLKFIYQHFYNYLPQFMENSFKGLGLIFDLGEDGIKNSKAAGIELGFFFQFGIMSYIMTAVIH